MKATLKQDEYESKLTEKITTMERHSQLFKDLAVQCSYQTQISTYSNIKILKSQHKATHREVVQQIARSRSEANLQLSNSNLLLQTESQKSQRGIQDLRDDINLLRSDQSKLNALMGASIKTESEEKDILRAEIRSFLKEFHRSNGRIDPRTNDS